MAKINLLPWRAERRKQRQKEFMTMLGVASAAAVLISLLIVFTYNARITAQETRNQYLTNQIAALDKQIVEIAELDKKKAGLLKRDAQHSPEKMKPRKKTQERMAAAAKAAAEAAKAAETPMA